jgi:hypothetical protein
MDHSKRCRITVRTAGVATTSFRFEVHLSVRTNYALPVIRRELDVRHALTAARTSNASFPHTNSFFRRRIAVIGGSCLATLGFAAAAISYILVANNNYFHCGGGRGGGRGSGLNRAAQVCHVGPNRIAQNGTDLATNMMPL